MITLAHSSSLGPNNLSGAKLPSNKTKRKRIPAFKRLFVRKKWNKKKVVSLSIHVSSLEHMTFHKREKIQEDYGSVTKLVTEPS